MTFVIFFIITFALSRSAAANFHRFAQLPAAGYSLLSPAQAGLGGQHDVLHHHAPLGGGVHAVVDGYGYLE